MKKMRNNLCKDIKFDHYSQQSDESLRLLWLGVAKEVLTGEDGLKEGKGWLFFIRSSIRVTYIHSIYVPVTILGVLANKTNS